MKHLPDPSEYPGAKAVIILYRTDVATSTYTKYGYETTTTVHVVKRIFDDISKESEVTIRIRPGQTLLKMKAMTVRPDGEVVPVRSDSIHTRFGGPLKGSVFHSDIEEVNFRFSDVKRGTIVEYAYSLRDNFPFPSAEWVIQRDAPIMRNIYSITAPSDLIGGTEEDAKKWVWNYVTYNYPDVGDPAVDHHYNTGVPVSEWEDTFTWTQKDVPAFEPEHAMPPKDWFRGYVQFSPPFWLKWSDVSTWYYNDVLAPNLVITKRLMKEGGLLVKGASSRLDSLSRIFAYVRHLRYAENKKRLGDVMPEAPQKVIDGGETDCRGKATLLLALLRSVGIEADPAVIITRSNGRLDTGFPCWRFHRLIVGAFLTKTMMVWLDPSAKYCGVGFVPPQDEAAVAMVMREKESSFFVSTPASQVWNNPVDVDVHIAEHPDSVSDYDARITYEGEPGLVMRNLLGDTDSAGIAGYCSSLIGSNFRDARLTGFSVTPPDSIGLSFTLAFTFSATNAVKNDSGSYSLYVDPFPAIENTDWLAGGQRKYPVEFAYPYVLRLRVVLSFDDSYTVRRMPKGFDIGNEDFDYSFDYVSPNPGRIIYTEVLTSRPRLLEPAGYERTLEFFGRVSAAKAEPVLLEKKE